MLEALSDKNTEQKLKLLTQLWIFEAWLVVVFSGLVFSLFDSINETKKTSHFSNGKTVQSYLENET